MKSAPFAAILGLLLVAGCTTTETTPPPPADTGPAVTADGYLIRLTRPAKVDDRYRVATTGSSEESIMNYRNGESGAGSSERYRYELVADCRVLAVSPRGHETKLELTIVKFTRITGRRTTPVLPPGTVVLARKSGWTPNYTVNNKPMAEEVAKLLQEAGFEFESDKDIPDEVIFGTNQRRKRGETWSIDAKAAAADLRKLGIPVTPKKLTGTITLEDVIPQEGGPRLRLITKLAMDGVNPPVPTWEKIDYSKCSARMSGLIPVDFENRDRQEAHTLEWEVKSSTKEGKDVVSKVMTIRATQETKVTYTPVNGLKR